MCRYRWTSIAHHTVQAGETADTAEMVERVELVKLNHITYRNEKAKK